MSRYETVEEYVEAQGADMAEVARVLAAVIDGSGLLSSRAVWYGHPVWSIGPAPADGPVVYVKAYTRHVTLGFWSAHAIDDPDGIVKIGANEMGSIKVASAEDARALPVSSWVTQAHAAVAKRAG